MTVLRLAVAACGLAALATTTLAADWSRFRGPNGSGAVDAGPVQWAGASGIAWKAEIPGIGHSSPIVVGDKVFLQSSSEDGAKRMLVCIDGKGKIEWTRGIDAKHPGKGKVHTKSSMASSTPTSDGERVFNIFWDGAGLIAVAYDLAGKELWKTPLGPFVSQHGFGGSPVAYAGKVYVNYDQDQAAEVLALNAKSGKIDWSAKRKPFRACSSSPLVRELPGGKTEIVVSSTAGLTGYDPADGKVNWNWEWKFDGMGLRTVGSPILANGTVIAVSGDGSGARSTVAVTPGEQAKLLWEKTKDTPYVPGPVTKGDYVYWVSDGGMAVCAEIKTGKILWSERAFQKSVSASLLLIGDAVFAVAEDGKAVAFQASPGGYEQVASSNVGEAVFATPAAANGKLYVRGVKHLFCIEKK